MFSYVFLPFPLHFFSCPLCSCSPTCLLYLLILLCTAMSARELQSLQAGVNSPPPLPPPQRKEEKKEARNMGSRILRQKHAKATKATTESNVEGSGEQESEARKDTTKGKSGGNKGKKTRWVACFITCIPTTLFRMTGAQQGARDKAENDKGIPAHLTPLSFLSFFHYCWASSWSFWYFCCTPKVYWQIIHPFLQAAVLVSIVSQKSLLYVRK